MPATKKKKVLVYGWYHQSNIGDDLFMKAFQNLFPEIDFTFTPEILESHLKDIDAIFFGGGSFLLDSPKLKVSLDAIKRYKLFYIGVGIEKEISTIHQQLMSQAQLVAIRTPSQFERVRQINPNTMVIPDLVYSLSRTDNVQPKLHKSVLILPNIVVVPKYADPNWKHAAWHYFKSEFCQFLDDLFEDGFKISLLPMCTALKEDDRWAAAELTSFTRYRSQVLVQPSVDDVFDYVSQHNIVLTQRFHGIVLAEACQVPYVAIHHHDKLKKQPQNVGEFISYYGISKGQLLDSFKLALLDNNLPILPIEPNIFRTLVQEVNGLL